jgi:hypothetical protein
VIDRRPRVIVFGATECRKLAAINSRTGFKYWRDEARGEDRFPEPDCTVNGRVEVWDPGVVLEWINRTREQRGMVWDRERGLIKRTETA